MTVDSSKMKYNVFFDESKAQSDISNLDITLMGSLLIPRTLYEKSDVQKLNQDLRDKQIKIHFTDYKDRNSKMYSDVLKVFLDNDVHKYLKFNVLAFSENEYTKNHVAYSPSTLREMIYSKIPERVIYGSVRNISKYKPTEARLYIENSTEYAKKELHKLLKKQLNVQALYRNDAYVITESLLYPKNKEIGVELTDCLLGIISLIMRNQSLYNPNGTLTSKTLKAKKKFIYKNKELLEPFLSNIHYFELNGVDKLTRRDFTPFFQEFILKYEAERPSNNSHVK